MFIFQPRNANSRDFKIVPEYRKKNILRGLVWRHLLPFYLKSNKLMAVNMSKKEDNKLIQHLQKLLPIFKIKVDTLFIYEWDFDTYQKYLPILSELDNFNLISNSNQKEIVINHNVISLYHVVSTDRILDNLDARKVVLEREINTQSALFMYSTTNVDIVKHLENQGILPTSIGSFVHYNTQIAQDISSAEI